METTDLVARHDTLDHAHVSNSNGNGVHEPHFAPRGANGHGPAPAPAPAPADRVVTQLGKVFKLLADETRLRILFELTHRDELHVRAFCELLGQSQPAVSHHLALLLDDGLIERRREGKHNFYRLVPSRMESLFELVFDGVPHDQRQFRIENYLLSFAPPV
jgi:ArsR family transcriptional regulator